MARLSFKEAEERLVSKGYEVKAIKEDGNRYSIAKEGEEIKFENGSKLVRWVKENVMGDSEASKTLESMIEEYYKTLDFEEKGQLFFTIDEFLQSRRSELSEEIIVRAENIIIMG